MGNITELSQGSLNGLRRQTNECLKNAYNKGYKDGKKEPREVKALNLEDTCEYQIGYKVGYEDGKKKSTTNAEGEKIIYSEEEMQSVIDATTSVEYNRGLEDLVRAMKAYYPLNSEERLKYFGTNIPVDRYAIENPKDLIAMSKAYEEKKQAEKEIRVGDEIKFDNVTNTKGVVVSINEGWYRIILDDGYVNSWQKSEFEKTGRNFSAAVSQLLDKLKEKREGE